MKHIIFLAIVLVISQCTPAHSQGKAKLLKEFRSTRNDSLFISQNSELPYEIREIKVLTATYGLNTKKDSLVFKAAKGDVIGPFEEEGRTVYYKITEVDSALRLHVGNIWIGQLSAENRDSIYALSDMLVKKAYAGEDFSGLCAKYSQDHNSNPDCDLGWFFFPVMVKEFSDEVARHKKGDIFATDTEYGRHVVKMLEDPVKERYKIKYVTLVIK